MKETTTTRDRIATYFPPCRFVFSAAADLDRKLDENGERITEKVKSALKSQGIDIEPVIGKPKSREQKRREPRLLAVPAGPISPCPDKEEGGGWGRTGHRRSSGTIPVPSPASRLTSFYIARCVFQSKDNLAPTTFWWSGETKVLATLVLFWGVAPIRGDPPLYLWRMKKKYRNITISVSEETWDRFRIAAEKAGMSLSAYSRRLMLAGEKRTGGTVPGRSPLDDEKFRLLSRIYSDTYHMANWFAYSHDYKFMEEVKEIMHRIKEILAAKK